MARKILPDGFIESSASNSVDKIFLLYIVTSWFDM